MQTHGLNNIIHEKAIDLTDDDFVDESGFFIRCGGAGVIKYCPVNNLTDTEAITKTVDATPYFIDPVLCRKVFRLTTTATLIYAGYGV